jgi:two-component system, sensor histidine kinase PdtaS
MRKSKAERAPRRSFWGPILRVVLPYLVLGSAWVLFSDRILLSLVDNPSALITMSTAKGWLYVLITGVLLSFLIYGELRRQLSLEDQLRKGLHEKSSLLFELNHRVKNNLQIMSSLLSLEAGSLEDEAARELNDRMSAHVRAMALAHEQFSANGGGDLVELGAYLRALWPAIAEIFKSERSEASFSLVETYVNTDAALPFGLFATEAIVNALRRGSFSDATHAIAISLARQAPDMAEFLVRDEGRGLKANGTRLSEELMEVLSQQLHGKLGISGDGGNVVRMCFPISGRRIDA